MKNGQDIQNHEDEIIEISKIINEINFSLKIYFSKDKQSIIFKVEQDDIQTHYYYEKFYLLDLKNNNKRFSLMNNLNEIFLNIKYIIEKYSTKIEEEPSNKIKIEFSNNSEIIATFSLRKKILSQNRLNPILVQQIQLNKNKIKAIKKQASKLEKSVSNQTDMINEINKKIESINENLNNIINTINNFKEDLKNEQINTQNQKKNKEEKSKRHKEEEINKNKEKIGIKEENSDKSTKKNFNNKNSFLELVFIINLFIIILIAYLFYRVNLVENNEILEKTRKNKLKSMFSILDALENLEGDDLNFIQDMFEEENNKKLNKIANMKDKINNKIKKGNFEYIKENEKDMEKK